MARRKRVARPINSLPLLGERAGVRGERHRQPTPVKSPHGRRFFGRRCRCNRTLTPALSHREREPVFATPRLRRWSSSLIPKTRPPRGRRVGPGKANCGAHSKAAVNPVPPITRHRPRHQR